MRHESCPAEVNLMSVGKLEMGQFPVAAFKWTQVQSLVATARKVNTGRRLALWVPQSLFESRTNKGQIFG